MLICLDVDYRDGDRAVAAGILFRSWSDSTPAGVVTTVIEHVAPYESGAFYKRELPCLLAILARVTDPIDAIVVDSYVLLDGWREGLGGHLYNELDGNVPVIGVAKTEFLGATNSTPVLRGTSKKPLFVSAKGIELQAAAAHVQSMAGEFRIPTLLTAVDRLCRDTPL